MKEKSIASWRFSATDRYRAFSRENKFRTPCFSGDTASSKDEDEDVDDVIVKGIKRDF